MFSAVEAAIKKPGRKDLALIYSRKEATVAGMFTTNRVKAAPVRVDMQKIKAGRGQAIVVNSGNANACTGERGMSDARETVKIVADGLKIKPSLVYVGSTGVIGMPMPMERVRDGLHRLIAGVGACTIDDVAAAIMTTDTFPKIVSRTISLGGKRGVIAGVCKGAGMINPRMATMLCFLLTDVAVERKALDAALRYAVQRSFNRITVDGDMSTNDTVLVMANGMLGNEPVTEGSRSYGAFRDTFADVSYELSRLIVRDGEGATKLVAVEVRGARNEAEAEKAAFAVANSNLVKTALYGNDANWGRIMAALGYSGIRFSEDKVDITFGRTRVVRRGISNERDEEAERELKGREVTIVIDLKVGPASATVLTCDLTEEYIKVNASYRT